MEQKQLDEIDESFFGEEIIDEEEVVVKTTKKKEKTSLNKKKSDKMAEKKSKENKENKENAEKPKEEVKKEEIKIESAASSTSGPEKVETWGDDPEDEDSLFKSISTWQAISGILVVLLIFSVFTNGFQFSNEGGSSGDTITLSEAEEKALDYVNTNLLQAPFTAELANSEELDTTYKLTLTVAGQDVDSYMTKDGNYFFPQGYETGATAIDLGEGGEGTTDTTGSETTGTTEVSVDDDDVKGDANAPVTIIEFSDFECPFCGRYIEQTYPEIVENYIETGQVKYVFRDFPLSFHQNAQKAAEAAECAGEQGMYWEMHDVLFANQETLDVDSLKGYAEELDLDTEEFDECLDSGEMYDEVQADMADGSRYGVQGTPAFFVNGQLLSGAQPYSAFEAAIEAALAQIDGEEAVEEEEEEVVAEEEIEEVVEEEAEEVVEEEEVVEVVTGETVDLSISAKKWMFTPRDLTANVGDTIELTIVPEDLDFTFAVVDLGVEEDVSGTTTVTFTVDDAGSYELSCSSCEEWRGMTGTLVVE